MFISLKRRESVYKKKISIKDIDRKEVRYIAEGIGLVFLVALFFYQSLIAVPFLFPVFLLYFKERKLGERVRQQKQVSMQFADAIMSVSANQKAGYSVENAFRQAYKDMELLYGKESIICRELHVIETGLANNMVLEKLLHDFGKKSGTEDVKEFAEVFAVAKRNGGNMTEIIERSTAVITQKKETEKEIQVLISAKQMEQKIMNVVPFGILIYVGMTSKGFFDVLYHNMAGIIIMTLCLFAYGAAVWISHRIVNIEV